MNYAKKVKADKGSTILSMQELKDAEEAHGAAAAEVTKDVKLTGRQKAVLGIFAFTFVVMIVGFIPLADLNAGVAGFFDNGVYDACLLYTSVGPGRFKNDIAIRPHVVGDIRHADSQPRRFDHGEVVCGIANGDGLGHRDSQHIGKACEPHPFVNACGHEFEVALGGESDVNAEALGHRRELAAQFL